MGIPVQIRSDGGPQFCGPLSQFCQSYHIVHELSFPYNPRSNRHAKAAIKNMEYLIQKYHSNWNNFNEALLEWQNTPRSDSLSPAQMMTGQHQRTTASTPCCIPAYLSCQWSFQATHQQRCWSAFPSWRICPKPGPSHKVLDHTQEDHWSSKHSPYYIEEENGATYLHNHHFLQPCNLSVSQNNLSSKDGSTAPPPKWSIVRGGYSFPCPLHRHVYYTQMSYF